MRSPKLSDAENDFLAHMQRWGSDGYPIAKAGRKWFWAPAFGILGSPIAYPTKTAAVAAVEAYLDILVDKLAGRL